MIRNEKGQSVVMVAIFMSLLLGLTAIVTDVGYLFFQRRHVQNTADAAALAGARALIDGDESIDQIVYQDVKAYVENNGLNENNILNKPELQGIRKSNDDTQVPVVLGTEHSLFFARVFGFAQGGVEARAVAEMGPLDTIEGGVIPIGVPFEVIGSGEGQDIDVIEFQMTFGPGNWGWISFEGTGNQFNPNTIANLLIAGYKGDIAVLPVPEQDSHECEEDPCPYCIQTRTGAANEAMRTSIDYLMGDNETGQPIPVYVPVIQSGAVGEGTSSFQIVGFAQIILTAETGNPAFWTITANVLRNTVGVGIVNPGRDATEFDVYGVRLIE